MYFIKRYILVRGKVPCVLSDKVVAETEVSGTASSFTSDDKCNQISDVPPHQRSTTHTNEKTYVKFGTLKRRKFAVGFHLIQKGSFGRLKSEKLSYSLFCVPTLGPPLVVSSHFSRSRLFSPHFLFSSVPFIRTIRSRERIHPFIQKLKFRTQLSL